MTRVFLDANVLFSAAWRENAGLLALWSVKGVRLITSGYCVEEARRNLETGDQRARLESLVVGMEVVPDVAAQDVAGLPLKDAPVLLAAIEGGAGFLLTGDAKHFGQFYGRKIQGVRVVRPADFLRRR